MPVPRIKSEVSNISTQNKDFDRSLELLSALKLVLDEECAAIDEIDDQKLHKAGEKIQKLLEELDALLPLKNNITIEQSDQLVQLLKEARIKRESNQQFLEESAHKMGLVIQNLGIGRKTLNAYQSIRPKDAGQELFLKKNC